MKNVLDVDDVEQLVNLAHAVFLESAPRATHHPL